ncbi:MAG: hypothetical protein AAF351_01370 [Pseudomonadota bacterium]
MNDLINGKPNVEFWIFGGAALIWYLVVLVVFGGSLNLEQADLTRMTADQQEHLLGTPMWATAAFGVAAISGVLGSVLLLLTRAWAVPAFALSAIAFVVQDIDAFVLRDAYGVMGVNSLIFQVPFLVAAIILLFYARSTRARGWLR